VKLVLASGNPGKLRELAALLEPRGYELVTQTALGVESAPETGATFTANALLKARHAALQTGMAALADDSGLMVDALDQVSDSDSRQAALVHFVERVGADEAAALRRALAELETKHRDVQSAGGQGIA